MKTTAIHALMIEAAQNKLSNDPPLEIFLYEYLKDYYREELGMNDEEAEAQLDRELETPPEGEEANKFLLWYFLNHMETKGLDRLLSAGRVLQEIDLLSNKIDQPITGFEMHPIHLEVNEAGQIIEHVPTDESSAHIYSIYVHLKKGGIECIADCQDKETADRLISLLQNACNFYVEPKQDHSHYIAFKSSGEVAFIIRNGSNLEARVVAAMENHFGADEIKVLQREESSGKISYKLEITEGSAAHIETMELHADNEY